MNSMNVMGCELTEHGSNNLAIAVASLLSIFSMASVVSDSYAQSPGQTRNLDTVRVVVEREYRDRLASWEISLTNSLNSHEYFGFDQVRPDEGAFDTSDGGCLEVGNPINMNTGAKIERELDFSAESNDMPLRFSRRYVSNDYSGSQMFGGMWSSAIEMRVSINGNTIHYFDELSRRRDFVLSSGGVKYKEAGVKSFEYFVDNQDGTYSFYKSDLTVETYALYGLAIHGVYQLKSVSNLNGVGWNFIYSASGDPSYGKRISNIVHTSGKKIDFVWSNQRLSKLVDQAGNEYNYIYDFGNSYPGDDRLIGVDYPGGMSVRYIYSANGALIEKRVNSKLYSKFGYTSHYWQEYDQASQQYGWADRLVASSTEHADGVEKYVIDYVIDTENRPGRIKSVTETNPLGKKTTYQYDDNGRLQSVFGTPTGSCLSSYSDLTYDANGYRDVVIRQDGYTVDYDYNDSGLLVKKVEGVGLPKKKTWRYGWDDQNGLKLWEELEGDVRVEYAYDAYSRMVSKKDINISSAGVPAQSRETRWYYSSHPNGMTSEVLVDGPLSGQIDSVKYSYSNVGDLIAIENGFGHKISYGNHDAMGRPAQKVGANGELTNYTYDVRGRLISETKTASGSASTTQYLYSIDGLLTSTVGPDGVVETYEYDNARRMIAILRAANGIGFERIEYDYNLMSSVTEVRTYSVSGVLKTLSGVNKIEYDELGRIKSRIGLNGQNFRYTYDANDNLTQSVDSLGRVTSLVNNEFGQVVTQTDPLGSVTRFEYDQAGRLNKVIDPRGLATTYVYDGFSQLWAQHSPDTGTTSFQYSAAGLRTLATKNDGSTLSFVYDDAGRLTWYGTSAQGRGFSYDWCQNGKGRLCEASYGAGTRHFAYSPFGQVQGTLDWTPSSNDWTGYTYDVPGRLTGISYPSGVSVGYGYSAGKLTTMVATMPDGSSQTVASNISYLPYGGIKSWAYGNGLARNYYYDQNLAPGDLRLTGITTMDGAATVQSMLLQYNSNNEITKITNFTNQNLTQDYTYDAVGRLTRMTFASGGQDFTFDANGNRTSHKWHPGWPNVTPEGYAIDTASNRVLNTHLNYTYDARGNRATQSWNGSTATYSYDAFNRLTQVSRDVASTWMNPNYVTTTYPAGATNYVVNALDQRVSKFGPLGASRYVYSGQNTLLAENTNGAWSSYLWLGGQPVGLVRNNTLYWIHDDHLGRPEMVTNAAKQRVWWANNYAYDRSVGVDSIGGLNLGLPGQYYDAESGHWYNGFRDYDSRLGRYIQSDPIGLQGGLNTYSYVKSSPTNLIDPLGLRDVFVAVWHAEGTSVGHVYLGEMDGRVLLSQFPAPHGLVGTNVTLTWSATLSQEGRRPDSMYVINVKNDAAFDKKVKDYRNRARWAAFPMSQNSTHCTLAANGALRAGGANLPFYLPTHPYTPNQFDANILGSMLSSGHGVSLVEKVPWE